MPNPRGAYPLFHYTTFIGWRGAYSFSYYTRRRPPLFSQPRPRPVYSSGLICHNPSIHHKTHKTQKLATLPQPCPNLEYCFQGTEKEEGKTVLPVLPLCLIGLIEARDIQIIISKPGNLYIHIFRPSSIQIIFSILRNIFLSH